MAITENKSVDIKSHEMEYHHDRGHRIRQRHLLDAFTVINVTFLTPMRELSVGMDSAQ